MPTYNNDAHNEYRGGSKTSEEIIVIYQILYFSDTASIEKHFYIGFEEYLMLGRENGTKTCLRTATTRIMNILWRL